MIKKIFVGILLAGVFGLLVLGAVNRTLAKSNENEPLALSEGNGAGNGGETLGRNESQGVKTGESREDGQGYGRDSDSGVEYGQTPRRNDLDGEVKNGFGGNSGSGQGDQGSNTQGNGTGVGVADVDVWEDPITVIVESVTPDLWVVSNIEGFSLEIEGRALGYLVDNGFEIEVGDELVLTGFFEGDKYEVGHVANNRTGQAMSIREDTGRPLWAGGRQGNRNP